MKLREKRIFILLFTFCTTFNLFAQQTIEEISVSLDFKEVTLAKALKQIKNETGITFAYNSNIVKENIKHTFSVRNESLKNVLDKLLAPHKIRYKFSNNKVILYGSKAKEKVTISGYVSDIMTGESLINANIYETSNFTGTITNNYGFYSLTLPLGQHEIAFSFVGYESQKVKIYLDKDTVISTTLNGNIAISEVKVVAHDPRHVNLLSSQMSRIDLPISKIEQLPALFGEVDVIKSLQLMPGIQSGTEGSSGLYVRGGGPDQNLILLDGVPIYNVSHLFGFFSVFNSNAIKNVSLSKGSFPARYGGRLSSVLDIRMKEGNEKEFHGNFKIGLISSNLNIEGPIVKDKTAFNFSARRTYIDLLVRPLIKKQNNGETKGYYFYDINAKINHKFSDNDRLYLSLYTGKDDGYGKTKQDEGSFESTNDFKILWRNIISAIRWNHIFSNKLFSNTTLTYSNYKFNVLDAYKSKEADGTNDYFEFDYNSGIEDVTAKIDFDYFPSPSHSIKFGANYTNHTFKPGVSTVKENDKSRTIKNTEARSSTISAHEYYFYAEDNINLSSRIKTNIGFHYSGFSVNGELYQSIQPRMSVRFLASRKLSFKAAYSKMNQYIYLLSSSTINLPTDLWLPITPKTKPQKSHQFAVGAFYNLAKGLDFSMEGYYKKSYNLIEYKEGASFTDSNDWQDKIETGGLGWSYGLEVLLKKTSGKTTGWIGYTLARTDRQFDNLNFGKKYSARFDRRHDVGAAITHKFNEKVDVGAVWVYGTGNAVTFSTQSHRGLDVYPNQTDNLNSHLPYYEGRNNYRMPAYHRLDIGINFHKKKKRGTRTWSIGTYNTYNKKNPFFIYKTQNADNLTTPGKIKQISLFPIIPSVSYSYKF